METFYPLFFVSSLALALLCVKYLNPHIKNFGIKGIDVNKEKKIEVPEAGGLLILPAIWVVTLVSIQLGIHPIGYVFLFTLSCFTAVGFFDDGFCLFKNEGGWARYLANRGLVLFVFTLPFTYLAFPIFFINSSYLLLFGYMLFSGALVLLCASLANSFAGINGWEVGSSAIVLAGLTVMVSFSEIYTSTLVSLCLIVLGGQLALFYFNKYPSKVFPGDAGTLLVGSFMGCMILFIDHWYIALCLFLPHIYDLLLKIRTNKGDMSQKKERPYVLADGKLNIPKSGKLDFAKYLIRRYGPMHEYDLSKKILTIVFINTLFWTLLYIIIKLI